MNKPMDEDKLKDKLQKTIGYKMKVRMDMKVHMGPGRNRWTGSSTGTSVAIIVFTYFVMLCGGFPRVEDFPTGSDINNWIIRLQQLFFLTPVAAKGEEGQGSPGLLQSSGGTEAEDAVSGEGPGGLMVTFRWKQSTQSYRIEASQPSTNYSIEPADGASSPIATGTTAPLNQWIVSEPAATAMGGEGLKLKYQTAEGEVILNLSTSIITLGELNIPTHILPNSIYKLNYGLSRTMPDMSSLPASQRPFIKMTVTGEHLNRPRTFFFPLESRKRGGEIIFILNHDEVEELNPQLKRGDFWFSSDIQIVYQLYIESGTSFNAEDKTFHINTSSHTIGRKVVFPLHGWTGENGDLTQLNLQGVSLTYSPPSAVHGYGYREMGGIGITGANVNDTLVCSVYQGSGSSHIILGMWPMSMFVSPSAGESGDTYVPLNRITLPVIPIHDNVLGMGSYTYFIVRQDTENWRLFYLSAESASFNGTRPSGSSHVNHGPSYAYEDWQNGDGFYNWRKFFAANRIEPGFYNASRGTRLYGGRIALNAVGVQGYESFHRFSTAEFWHSWSLMLESPVVAHYLSHHHAAQPPHYHNLHYQHVNHANLMDFHLEAVDRDGEPLYVSYDPTYIDKEHYRNNIPHQDIPPENTFEDFGFRLELPSDCQKYPVFLKVKSKFRSMLRVVTRWGADPPQNRAPHIAAFGLVPPIESCKIIMCPNQVATNAPMYENIEWVVVRPPTVIPPSHNCQPVDGGKFAHRIVNAAFGLPVFIPERDFNQPSYPPNRPVITRMTCLNCPGPNASVDIPHDSPVHGNGPRMYDPFIPADIVKTWAGSVVGSNGTMDEWIYLHVRIFYANQSDQVFAVRVHRPPVLFNQFVPKVAAWYGVAVDATTPCPEYQHINPDTGTGMIYAYPVCDQCVVPGSPVDEHGLGMYHKEEFIHTKFYYPGLPTRRMVYMSYVGFPFDISILAPGEVPHPENPTNKFRLGIRQQDIPAGVDIWGKIDGFGTVYKLSGAVDGDGNFIAPFHTILPHAGSFHNPEIHATLKHRVVENTYPASQTTNGCPEFPAADSVRITPSNPPPSNFPVNVTVEIEGLNYDYGVINGGLKPVIFFKNGSYQVQIPGGRNRRGITVTLYADGCPTAVREILFPPLPVRPTGWRIAADPNYPVVQPAGVTEGQRLYWQGPTFQAGLKVLKNLATKYQEKFGTSLPQTPNLPPRKGVTNALNTKSTGVRWGGGW